MSVCPRAVVAVAASLLAVFALGACRPSPPRERHDPHDPHDPHGAAADARAGAPDTAPDASDVAQAQAPPARAEAVEGSGAPTAVPAPLAPLAPPDVRLDEQRCATHEDCRVFQPGDWNARVECCYEYGCELDYVAVSTETWAAIRAWQRANPFDCAAHLRDAGPCNPRGARCGLIQHAPAAACVEGLCQLAFPEVWPAVDPDAQRCTSPADCLAFRPASTGSVARCCGGACDGEWIAINRDTAEEVDRWRNNNAPSCEDWRERNACPPTTTCSLIPPPVTCRGGECVVE